MRGLLSDSLSSSLEDDILGFGLLVGRRGDSEPEDGSIFTFAIGAGAGLEAGLFKVGLSSILFSSCFDGPLELERKLPVFLSTDSLASDSVEESGSIAFT